MIMKYRGRKNTPVSMTITRCIYQGAMRTPGINLHNTKEIAACQAFFLGNIPTADTGVARRRAHTPRWSGFFAAHNRT